MAARRSPPTPPPTQAKLTPDELRNGVKLLRRRLTEVEAFDPSDSAAMTRLQTSIEESLERIFGKESSDYNRYWRASKFDWGPISMSGTWGRGTSYDDRTAHIKEGRDESIQLLKTAIGILEERLDDVPAPQPETSRPILATQEVGNKIFVVHGHDLEVRESVARLLERLELEAVILEEKPNEGQTIIEKFEAHSDVGYAIVLLTPDDVGGVDDQKLQPRARQNVILELGYFVGALSRKRVCALVRKPIELPSDIHGLVWVEWNADWRFRLAKELKAAGFVIDLNRL
jgi:predicted nucleotide-binding protein